MSDSDDDSGFQNTMAAFTVIFNPQMYQTFVEYLDNEEVKAESSSRPFIPRRNIPRDHLGAVNRLYTDETAPGATPAGTSDPAMDALFRDDPIRRAPGRNVSCRILSSSDATSGRSSGSEVSQQISNLVRQQAEALARFEISDAMKFLAKPIPDGLSRKDYKAQVAYRKHLQEQFGNQFYVAAGDSDEDEGK